ncbi:hypothetical protein HRbin06_00504 [archaeon HR06]|nr:hypothetical protein HRbin06_00504 [archaeon HR06]
MWKRFIFLLFLGIIIRILSIIYLKPLTDVYYVLTKGVLDLMSFKDPYEDNFKDFVPEDLITKGSEFSYVYMPLETLFLLPFYLLFGDIRYGSSMVNIILAYFLYLSIKDVKGKIFSSFLYLILMPLIEVIYSNHTNITSLFLLLTFLFIKRENLSSLFYGLALATSQLAFLSLPFVLPFWIKIKRIKGIIIIFLPLIASSLPFLLHNSTEFLKDIFFFQFTRESYHLVEVKKVMIVNMGLNGIFYHLTGIELDIFIRLALSFLALLISIIKFKDIIKRVSLASLLIIFLLPKNTFLTYFLAYLPLLLLVIPYHKIFKGYL